MGFLQLSSGVPVFSKAVISLWFRVPSAAMAAATAQYNDADPFNSLPGSYDSNLLGIIPLLTFGPNPTVTTDDGSTKLSPSFIGINCGGIFAANGNNDPPALVARIQYNSGHVTNLSGFTSPDYFDIGYLSLFSTFFASSAPGQDQQSILVSPDVWHHVIMSFDMSAGCSTSYTGPGFPAISFGSSCKLWLSFDDVNYNRNYLWPANPYYYTGGGGDNDIVSNWCFYLGSGGGGPPTSHSFSAGNIPTSGQPLGIPTSSANASHVYQMERAYMQVFTGVSIDTSVEENRRAFIKSDGTPELDYSIAQGLLGKSPVIRLHSGKNWQSGKNTGSGPSLSRTGTINSFATAPNLGA